MKQERFFQYLQHEKRFSPHTLTAYRKDLGQFTEFLEKTYEITSPGEVRHTHVRSWMVDLMEKGNVARSINRKLSCLKTYFKFLRKNGEIEANPMIKVVAPKTGKRLPVFVNEKNMALLFEQVDFGEGFSGLRNRLLMEVLYCTGMRQSELIGLKLGDVDYSNFQLKVLGKRRKERLIPIARHLVDLIEQYIVTRKAAFPENEYSNLFLTDKGQPLYPGYVYKIVKKYLSQVTTVEQRSPHVLRHTFATHLSNRGADLNAIKELLGHSSLAATQVYTHNSIEKLKKVYQQAHPKAKTPTAP
jgi:integrase/recombinase XerC